VIILGIIRLTLRKSGIVLPHGGSCSAIISAACHGPPGDDTAALELVQYSLVSFTPERISAR
jgi:hypothetical protein